MGLTGFTGPLVDTGSQQFNVKAFNAYGDGSHDDTSAIQAAITAAQAVNGVVLIPPGTYNISSALTITGAVTILGWRATLAQTAVNANALSLSAASDVTIEGLTLTSPGYATQHTSSVAINILGTSAASPAARIHIRRCKLTSWAMYGIYALYVTDFDFSDNEVYNVNHAGIAMLSCSYGTVCKNRIDNVVDTPNAYGVTATLLTSNSLVTDPVSHDIVIQGNRVSNVVNWEGLDTHGGARITFDSNIVINCPYGISAGEVRDLSNNPVAAATDVAVTNNRIVSGVTNGTAQNGINLTGAGPSVGTTTVYATGVISGNTIRGYGNDVGGGGAIYLHDTMSVRVTHNTIWNPSPRGVHLYHDNYDFYVGENSVVDPWTNVNGTAPAIQLVSDYNQGTIGHNTSYTTGTQSGTHVLDTHLYVSNSAHNAVTNVPGRSTAATLLNDAGGLVQPLILSTLQLGSTALPTNNLLFARKDAASVQAMGLQNLNTSSAAAAQFQMSANACSGGLAAFGSAFATARQAQKVGIYANSNPKAIILDAPNANQTIDMYAGGTSLAAQLTNLLLILSVGLQPVHQADASAQNDSIYYSTTVSKLVYKDSGGVVNALY